MEPVNDTQRELEEISPFLSRLPKNTPYSVPPGYFEQLPATVLAQAKQAKVVTMTPRRSPWRIAVAAAVAAVIIAGGWLLTTQKQNTTPDAVASLQKQMQQVSDTEIAAYVEGSDIAQPDDLSGPSSISDEDVPLVLADVSDQELQQYVDQEIPSSKLN